MLLWGVEVCWALVASHFLEMEFCRPTQENGVASHIQQIRRGKVEFRRIPVSNAMELVAEYSSDLVVLEEVFLFAFQHHCSLQNAENYMMASTNY